MTPALAEILRSERKAKAKAKALSEALLAGTVSPGALRGAIEELVGSDRGTVVEALEGATRKKPALVDARLFDRLVECLADPAPRVRWEAARTVANVAAEHPRRLDEAVTALLVNTKHEGTVVRWATAQALASIVRARGSDGELVAKVRKLAKVEADDGVRAVYEKVLRRVDRLK